jgi:shikimate dehydrogenase
MNGQTQVVGIVGWPIAHSKSPAMHNAAFSHLGLNFVYVPFPVNKREHLPEAIKGLRAAGLRGVNVTVPYKEDLLSLCDEVSKDARKIGAVNTVIFKDDGRIYGENTDAFGFLAHLNDAQIALDGEEVAVIGAGGAARAIVFALLQGGAKSVVVLNRNLPRAEEISKQFAVEALDWSTSSFNRAVAASIVINTTSLGLHADDAMPWPSELAFSPSQRVYDAIYKDTPFLQKARSEGATALSGLGMLLWQGVKAFELWTGVKAPVDVMKRELDHA